MEKTREFQKKTFTSASLTMVKPLTMWIIKTWKVLKEMGIPDHLTCLLRKLYADQETTVRLRHETMDWLKIGRGIRQSCILSPCLFKLYAEHIMQNARLDESQAGIKIVGWGKMLTTSYVQMIPLKWQKVKRNEKAS